MDIPAHVRDLCQALLSGLLTALGDTLYGVYVYGAIASPEGGATGDVDFHAILKQAPGDEAKSALQRLHAALARAFPPLGVELDGYYILLDDARRPSPPPHLALPGVCDESWALNRAHILAGRCIVLYGPDPAQVYTPPSWPELERNLWGELRYVEEHLSDYPAYGILNLCRLMCSFRTGDVVVSKRASAAWARAEFPQWAPHIDAALRFYDGQTTAADHASLEGMARELFAFADGDIRKRGGSPCAPR